MTSTDPTITTADSPPPVLLPAPATPEAGLALAGQASTAAADAVGSRDFVGSRDAVGPLNDARPLDAVGSPLGDGQGTGDRGPATIGPPPHFPGAFWWPAPDDLPPPRPHERRPPGPATLPPGFLLASPSGSPPPRIDVPATLERLRSAQRLYAASLLGAVAVQLTSLPWSLLSGVLAVLGRVAGARALHLAGLLRRAGTATRGRIAIGIGLGLSTLMIMQMLVQLVVYPVESDYQACQAAAQTKAAAHACQDERDRRLKLGR